MAWNPLASTWSALGSTWSNVDSGSSLIELAGTSTSGTYSEGALEVIASLDVDLAGTSATLSGSTGSLEVSAAGAPATPLGLTLSSPTPTSILVSWSASPTAEFYDLERQRWDGVAWVGALSISNVLTLSYTDTSVASGTQYRYRVRAGKAA